MPAVEDRVQETTTTAGTGTVTLAGAVSGYRTFASAFVVGQEIYYALTNGTAWEVGIGKLVTSSTLSRTLIASSTGSLISLSGTTNIWCDYPADTAIQVDPRLAIASVPAKIASYPFTARNRALQQLNTHNFNYSAIYSAGLAVTFSWGCIGYSPDLEVYVALPAGSATAYYSYDGEVFTAITMPGSKTWVSVCWARELGLFIATNADGVAASAIATSPDGLTWTFRTAPAAQGYYAVCWSPDLKMALCTGSNGVCATSSDGSSWVAAGTTPASTNAQQLIWVPALKLFVGAFASGVGTRAIATSPDGTTWNGRTTTVTIFHTVAWSPTAKRLVALSKSGGANSLVYSTDGVTWTGATSPFSATGAGVAVGWSGILGMFIAITSTTANNNVAWSIDGITWNTPNSDFRSGTFFVSSTPYVLVTDTNDGAVIGVSNTSGRSLCYLVSSERNLYVASLAECPFIAYGNEKNYYPTYAQPLLSRRKVALWTPSAGATTGTVVGMPAFTTVGTPTWQAMSPTSRAGSSSRVRYATAGGAAGQLASNRITTAQYFVGSATYFTGGFFFSIRFSINDNSAIVTVARSFWGLSSTTTAPTNVEPSTLLNCIGIGHGAADTNLKIYWGGSAAQTPVDLGANFPITAPNQDVYEASFYSPSNQDNVIFAHVDRYNNTNQGTLPLYTFEYMMTGTAGTAIPAHATLLTPWMYRTNNTATGAVAFDLMSLYIDVEGG